jgi:hypothetical protein
LNFFPARKFIILPLVAWRSDITVDCVWNVKAQAPKPDFVFRRNGSVHLNRRGRQFSLLLAAEVCASAVVMLDTPCSEVVWRVLATHCIRQFPLHFPFPCVTVCHHISTGLYYSNTCKNVSSCRTVSQCLSFCHTWLHVANTRATYRQLRPIFLVYRVFHDFRA